MRACILIRALKFMYTRCFVAALSLARQFQNCSAEKRIEKVCSIVVMEREGALNSRIFYAARLSTGCSTFYEFCREGNKNISKDLSVRCIFIKKDDIRGIKILK